MEEQGFLTACSMTLWNKNKGKEQLNQTTKLKEAKRQEPEEKEEIDSKEDYSDEPEDDLPDDERIDDELVRKQQKEAEELLEDAKQTINEEDQVTNEEEEDEVEEDEKIAKENKYDEENDEGEGNEDEDMEKPTITKDNKFELNYTVGRIEDGAAILISKDHNLIEIPLCLLPSDIGPGNILRFSVDRNYKAEKKRVKEILSIQKQILEDPIFFEE